MKGGMFGLGSFNETYAQYFSGKSYLNPLTKPGESTANEWCEAVTAEEYNRL